MDVLQKMAKVPTDVNDKPRVLVKVFDSGELDLNTGLVKSANDQSIFNQNRDNN